MTRKRQIPTAPSCDENARHLPDDLAARYAGICLNPMVWPLTAQVPPPSGPSAFSRWLRKGVRRRS